MKKLVISDFIGAIASQLPAVCRCQLNDLKELTATLPHLLSNTLIFEYCLAREDTSVDLSLGINSAIGGRNLLLAGMHPYIDLPQELLENDAWQQVRAFAQAWLDMESKIYNFVDTIWLEFDSEPTFPSFPIPSFFFATSHVTSSRINEAAWVTNDALKLIFGRSLTSNIEEQLYQCIRLLPKETFARSFGIMLSRGEERVRMVTSKMPADQVLDYLTQVGWSGYQLDIQPIMAEIGKIVRYINVSIDIGNSIGSRLGLELQPDDGLVFNEVLSQWKQIFDIVSAHKLCATNVRQEILSFPGIIDERALVELPETWQYATALIGHTANSLTVKSISHLKLVVESGKPLQAKIYLKVGQVWVSNIKFG
jgi:hypothetical protein